MTVVWPLQTSSSPVNSAVFVSSKGATSVTEGAPIQGHVAQGPGRGPTRDGLGSRGQSAIPVKPSSQLQNCAGSCRSADASTNYILCYAERALLYIPSTQDLKLNSCLTVLCTRS
jgi:hypothetical protein